MSNVMGFVGALLFAVILLQADTLNGFRLIHSEQPAALDLRQPPL